MRMADLSRRKDFAALAREAQGDASMRRALGPVQLTAIGIGGIIGAGIFVLTGTVAANHAGPGIVLSFALAGLACAFAALCYAEFAAMIPMAGSAYSYAYATLGEFFAWFIGWDLVLEYAIAAATVAVGWSGYVASLLRSCGLHLPPEIAASTGTQLIHLGPEVLSRLQLQLPAGWYDQATYAPGLAQIGVALSALPQATAWCNLPAMIVVLLASTLLVVGIRESATINAGIVVLKLAIVLTVIGVGIAFVNPALWVPFVPPNTGVPGAFGWSGIARGAGVIFFAYIGFDAVSTAAQEARNPQRDMPIGIVGSLVICTVLYIAVSLVVTGVVHYTRLNVADPIALAIDVMGIPWLAVAVKLGAIAGLSSVVLVLLLGQARIFYAIARDGLLPPLFARIHPRFRTPATSTALTGVAVAVVAGSTPIHLLGELVSIGTLCAFAIVCGSVLVLRHRHPEYPRPFRTPFVPVVPVLGILFCVYLMLGLPIDTWIRLVIWMAIGMAIYFGYGVRRSALRIEAAALAAAAVPRADAPGGR